MIVFKSGWNFNPTKHETIICSHRLVRHCILVGTGRELPAAIIELRTEPSEDTDGLRQAILAELKPKIDEANSFADTSGQLREEAIIFAKQEKPFAIAGKGTVQRSATVALYNREIDELYASLGMGRGVSF